MLLGGWLNENWNSVVTKCWYYLFCNIKSNNSVGMWFRLPLKIKKNIKINKIKTINIIWQKNNLKSICI